MTPDQIKSNWALFMECRHGKDLQNATMPEAVLIFAEQISKLSAAMEREAIYTIVKTEIIDTSSLLFNTDQIQLSVNAGNRTANRILLKIEDRATGEQP